MGRRGSSLFPVTFHALLYSHTGGFKFALVPRICSRAHHTQLDAGDWWEGFAGTAALSEESQSHKSPRTGNQHNPYPDKQETPRQPFSFPGKFGGALVWDMLARSDGGPEMHTGVCSLLTARQSLQCVFSPHAKKKNQPDIYRKHTQEYTKHANKYKVLRKRTYCMIPRAGPAISHTLSSWVWNNYSLTKQISRSNRTEWETPKKILY